MNRPIREDGTVVELREPGQMSDEDLIHWRDHIIYSFTEGSGCKNPFMFASKGGEPPRLKVMRIKEAQSISSAKKRSSPARRGRGRGTRENGAGSGTKKTSRAKSKAIVEDSEPEAELTEEDEKPAKAAALPKEGTRLVDTRPKPRPVALKKPEFLVTAYSMTLQLPEMQEGSTLISSWKVRSYQWKKVSWCQICQTIVFIMINNCLHLFSSTNYFWV